MDYTRETPFDDSVETNKFQRYFIELNEREPFDDNELFLFIDREHQSHAENFLIWQDQ